MIITTRIKYGTLTLGFETWEVEDGVVKGLQPGHPNFHELSRVFDLSERPDRQPKEEDNGSLVTD